MQPIQRAVTGREPEAATSLDTPFGALAQFYCAFNAKDLVLMEANWSISEEIAMDNPLGGIARGWSQIRPLYEKLFDGPMNVEVEFYDYTLHQIDRLAYVVGRERGSFSAEGEKAPVAIRTTRVFKLAENRWRQVHHHGSIEDPAVLRRYKLAAGSHGA